jgi:opacity protein-like surface antigen
MSLTKLLRTSAAALGALAVASFTQANAADIYSGGGFRDIPAPLPIPIWSGFYVGGNLGVDWSNVDIRRVDILTPAGVAVPFGGQNINSSGGFGGGQFGYNWQWPGCCFVYGIEVDLGGLANRSERGFSGTAFAGGAFAGAAAARVHVDGGFFGDVTGRLGYTWGSTLVYAKGGFAWLNTDVNISGTFTDATGVATGFSRDSNTTLAGFTVGGGFEHLLNPNWSMKLEYMFYEFGAPDTRCCNDGLNNFRITNNDLTVHTFKLGFNYFFHSTPVPLK